MHQNKTKIYLSLACICLIIVGLFSLGTVVRADLVSEIKNKIDTKSNEIKKLQDEIKAYEASLDKTSAQAASLNKELNSLLLAKKKLETDLKLTQKNLEVTSSVINGIQSKIQDTEKEIDYKKLTISNSLRNIRFVEDISPIENLLASRSLVEMSDYIEQAERINTSISEQIRNLQDLESNLSDQKTTQEQKKGELKKLQTNLSGQQKAVSDTAKEKDKLLTVTKNQESNYKKILEEKIKLRAQFESELYDYESQLKIAIDPSKLPSVKRGVLSWPLEKVRITQLFGKTSSSGRLYSSGTHNGIDLGASDGTKVMAALSGKVQATGNTDLKTNCYSYGKWVLIKHANGLSTLYGHLSSISVDPGDSIDTGDIIGYSGHTGYVTGPHLHFTVLATEGVRVMPIPTATNCKGVTIPIGDPKAFLDPLLYLPNV